MGKTNGDTPKSYSKFTEQGKPIIYGAVTTGFDWLFLQLEGNTALADTDVYQLSNLPQILGILNYISR